MDRSISADGDRAESVVSEQAEQAGTEPVGAVQPAPDDAAIVALFFSRDEDALAYSRAKYGGLCQSVAASILGSPEDAEECVGDAWMRAWNAIPPEKPVSLGAYLAAVTRRLALDRRRERTAEKRGGGEIALCLDELADIAGDGDGWDAEGDARERLRDALKRFLAAEPPLRRRVFLWRYWYAHPVGEVARLSGKSEGAVKMILSRAKKRLKKMLEEEGFTV